MGWSANAWYSATAGRLFRLLSGHFSARRLTPLRVFIVLSMKHSYGLVFLLFF